MASGVDGLQYYLFVPTQDEQIPKECAPVLNSLDKLGVAPVIHVICESEARNLQRLQGIDPTIDTPQPCLLGLDAGKHPKAGPWWFDQIGEALSSLGKRLAAAE
jgi:hypothetical protein